MKTQINSPQIGPLPLQRNGQPLLHPPTMSLVASAKALTTEKMSNKRRKLFIRSRDRVVIVNRDEAQPQSEKLGRKLAALPLVKVLSFQRRFARRASTVMHTLRKMAPDSIFRPGLEQAQRANLGAMNLCTREHQHRASEVVKRFAPLELVAA